MAVKISRYRDAVMGAAILWIMASHSNFSFPPFPVLSQLANCIKADGFGGVDIFLFLSGFGLYLSLSRSPDPFLFYWKRLKRILPAYLPVLVVWLLLQRDISLRRFLAGLLYNLTGISFWAGKSPCFNWYMPALVSFYAAAPAFFQIIKRYGRRGELCLIIFTLLMDLCFLGNYVMIAVSRFTIFALGMLMGRRFLEERRLSLRFEAFTCLSGVLGYLLLQLLRQALPSAALWNYGLYWYPFLLIAPAAVFLLCRFFSFLEAKAAGQKLLRVFQITGQCSLELYLIHIVVFPYLRLPSLWPWPAIYAAAILAGCAYHALLSRLPGLSSAR